MKFIEIVTEERRDVLINVDHIIRIDRSTSGFAVLVLSTKTVLPTLNTYGAVKWALGWTHKKETVIEIECTAPRNLENTE